MTNKKSSTRSKTTTNKVAPSMSNLGTAKTAKLSKKVRKKVNKKVLKKSAKNAPVKTAARRRPNSRSSTTIATTALKASLKQGLRFWGLRFVIVSAVMLFATTAYLDVKIRKQFEGQKWALPAHVYTRPMELYVGQQLDLQLVEAELLELGYQARPDIQRVGSYKITVDTLLIHQREFRFWDGLQSQQQLTISLQDQKISNIDVGGVNSPATQIEIVRLEPRLFGSVSPLSHEDRSLLKLADVPPMLIRALIAIEDRQFYSHFGINPMGIARAMLRNISAGRVVQGGSTLTQQLVKNYYLSSDRTIKRKVTEVIMAILLEVHYSKDEILEAYLNEVYLSQAGNRAIHGFALGSQYFFGRPLHELDLPELAMLAGIIKGPSYYSPMRNPERARQRRDLVLKTMLEQQLIDQTQYEIAIVSKLRISNSVERVAPLSYPSFMGFVRDNLNDGYQQRDLSNDGLQIHTTLNPRIQQSLEQIARTELTKIEKARGIGSDTLQIAAVVIRTDNGEVAAMIGDRKSSFSGFNRAVDARRPVGSLLKPFVYLTALESPHRYSLASRIDDAAITVSQNGSPDWKPQNYDNKEHGSVMMVDALARSYNLATVRLGMQVGVSNVSDTIERLGYQLNVGELPSLLLGAVPMSVMDVAQMYLSLASGGFKTPIKGVRSVLSNINEPLARYPLAIEQVVEPQFNYLINYALQEVVRSGTGRGVLNGFRYDYGLAGKTGTTDDYRDSWFAGFSGNYLTIVWIGRDDNKSTGLTGASGAAKVWAKLMQKIPLQRLELPYNEDVISQRVYYSLDQERQDCSLSRQLPILLESLPLQRLPCAERMPYDLDYEDELQHFEPGQRQQLRKSRKRKSFWQSIFG
jgi:penicillin-binding protein 1B